MKSSGFITLSFRIITIVYFIYYFSFEYYAAIFYIRCYAHLLIRLYCYFSVGSNEMSNCWTFGCFSGVRVKKM
jgi:hypothetical protein